MNRFYLDLIIKQIIRYKIQLIRIKRHARCHTKLNRIMRRENMKNEIAYKMRFRVKNKV